MEKEQKKEYSNTPNVKEIKSNETFEKEMFTIVNHNGEFMVAMGNRVLSNERFDSREAAEHFVDCKPWELILNATAYMWERLQEIKEQLNNK